MNQEALDSKFRDNLIKVTAKISQDVSHSLLLKQKSVSSENGRLFCNKCCAPLAFGKAEMRIIHAPSSNNSKIKYLCKKKEKGNLTRFEASLLAAYNRNKNIFSVFCTICKFTSYRVITKSKKEIKGMNAEQEIDDRAPAKTKKKKMKNKDKFAGLQVPIELKINLENKQKNKVSKNCVGSKEIYKSNIFNRINDTKSTSKTQKDDLNQMNSEDNIKKTSNKELLKTKPTLKLKQKVTNVINPARLPNKNKSKKKNKKTLFNSTSISQSSSKTLNQLTKKNKAKLTSVLNKNSVNQSTRDLNSFLSSLV